MEHTFEQGTGTRDNTTGSSKEFVIQIENMCLNSPPNFISRDVRAFLGSKGLHKMCCNPGLEKNPEWVCPVLLAWWHQSKDLEQEGAVPNSLVWVRQGSHLDMHHRPVHALVDLFINVGINEEKGHCLVMQLASSSNRLHPWRDEGCPLSVQCPLSSLNN